MVLETALGLDRLVIMPRNSVKGNRRTCQWVAVAALCCMGGLGLAGCRQGPAASQPVVTPSSSSGAASGSLAAASSPFAGASAYLTGPDASPHPAGPATGDAHSFTTVGPLVVEQQADVVAERDGRITAVNVEISDHVRKGEVLALLDDRALQATRAEKSARIDSLRAQVQSWEAEQRSNEADLRRADAMRAEKILDDEDWEHVQYKLTETKSQVARYKADELAAEAELHAADVELTQSRITAPFDGVVGRRSVHDAQAVKKGDALFWITAQAPLRILFTVPESAMAVFPRGARLELTTTDYPHLKQTAVVFRVSPVVDPASGSIEVIGSLEKPSPLLKPGMSMQVKLSPR
jgi:membrane fusion protein, multidrug efflux system